MVSLFLKVPSFAVVSGRTIVAGPPVAIPLRVVGLGFPGPWAGCKAAASARPNDGMKSRQPHPQPPWPEIGGPGSTPARSQRFDGEPGSTPALVTQQRRTASAARHPGSRLRGPRHRATGSRDDPWTGVPLCRRARMLNPASVPGSIRLFRVQCRVSAPGRWCGPVPPGADCFPTVLPCGPAQRAIPDSATRSSTLRPWTKAALSGPLPGVGSKGFEAYGLALSPRMFAGWP
jgi:hypothetical protein